MKSIFQFTFWFHLWWGWILKFYFLHRWLSCIIFIRKEIFFIQELMKNKKVSKFSQKNIWIFQVKLIQISFFQAQVNSDDLCLLKFTNTNNNNINNNNIKFNKNCILLHVLEIYFKKLYAYTYFLFSIIQ